MQLCFSLTNAMNKGKPFFRFDAAQLFSQAFPCTNGYLVMKHRLDSVKLFAFAYERSYLCVEMRLIFEDGFFLQKRIFIGG